MLWSVSAPLDEAIFVWKNLIHWDLNLGLQIASDLAHTSADRYATIHKLKFKLESPLGEGYLGHKGLQGYEVDWVGRNQS